MAFIERVYAFKSEGPEIQFAHKTELTLESKSDQSTTVANECPTTAMKITLKHARCGAPV